MTKAQAKERVKQLAAACEAMEGAGEIPVGWSKEVCLAMLPIVFKNEAVGQAFN